MGCVSSNDVKNPKNNKPSKDGLKQIQPAMYKSKIGNSKMSKIMTPRNQQPPPKIQPKQTINVLKIKKTTSAQFLSTYQITQTLAQTTRTQGPKLITNKINGTVSVLRVYNPDKIDEERLKKFHQMLKFELYTDEQDNYLLIDEFCSESTVCELFEDQSVEESVRSANEKILSWQAQIHRALLQVHEIITMFHAAKLYLGKLNLFSFRKVSQFEDRIKLVEYNFDKQEGSLERENMGHAHQNSYQADWEFFGYLLQFYLSSKSPIFIPHKMQYIQTDGPCSMMISSLLKGRQLSRKQLQKIPTQSLKIRNNNVLYGYKFCRDVLKLIKARKRRVKHKLSYYSMEVFSACVNKVSQNQIQNEQGQEQFYKLKNLYNPEEKLMLTEENLHRLETERIMSEIEKYIQKLSPDCEQHFINYSMAAENFRKLKEIFLINEKRRKLDEFKQLIPQIK